MTNTDNVLVERDGPVTIISINRPHCRNAVDGATARKLFDAFKAFDADAEASVAVFTGTGGYFCAGADLKAVASGDPDKKREIGGQDSIAPMGPSRLRLSKPVIAAVEGFAVAGGMELALWADMRVVAEDATFGVFCRRFAADRPRDHPDAEVDRSFASDRPYSHRTPGRRARGAADGSCQSIGAERRGARPRDFTGQGYRAFPASLFACRSAVGTAAMGPFGRRCDRQRNARRSGGHSIRRNRVRRYAFCFRCWTSRQVRVSLAIGAHEWAPKLGQFMERLAPA